jgi:hypothetical protein
MSKHKRQGNTLPPLQKKIVLHLAKTGPQTINQTVKKIKHSYKPSWTAFNSLEKKGIVRKGKTKEYRGNEYPLYWLTEEGVITALLEGASPIDLLTKTKEVYPNNQMLQYGLEMAPNLNLDIFRIFLTALKSKGTLSPVDLGTIFFTQMDTDTTFEKLVKALETMKKYPKEYKHFKEQISRIQENFSKLAKII